MNERMAVQNSHVIKIARLRYRMLPGSACGMATAARMRACVRAAINSPEFNSIDAVIRGVWRLDR